MMHSRTMWIVASALLAAGALRADPRLHGTWYDAAEGGNFTVHPDGRFTSAGETGRWSVMGDTFVFRPASGGLESWRYQVQGDVIVATSPAYGTRRFTRVGGARAPVSRDQGGLGSSERPAPTRRPAPFPTRRPAPTRRSAPSPIRRPAPSTSPAQPPRAPRPAAQRAGRGPVMLRRRWRPADRQLDFELPKGWTAYDHPEDWNDVSFAVSQDPVVTSRVALHRAPTREPVALDLRAEAEQALTRVAALYPGLRRSALQRLDLASGYPAIVASYTGGRGLGPDRAWAAYLRGEGEYVLALITGDSGPDYERRRGELEGLLGSLMFR